ncbi:MAG TPA: thiamine pyrophosphate-binding protein [Burkholderiales bacterium]|nr:thiamine pyrophosphate-binding protein [Burkholderiales bacterium]
MTGARALVEALGAMGVERIFASPGSDWAPLWEVLASPGEGFPEYVSSRHEETAVGMAIGYAKASGKLPAVVLHTTVGALHASMLLRSALHERIPMVVLAGESIAFGEPPARKVGRQWLRILTDVGGPARLMEHCVKQSVPLNVAALLPRSVQRACQLACAAPRGPVFLSVPTEHLMEEMRADLLAAAIPGLPQAPAARVQELARALGAAKKPVIVAEEAGRDAGAVDALVAVAEALGAPVLEGWQSYYVNFPRGHALYAGLSAEEVHPLLKESDFVLLVESVLPWHPPSALRPPKVGLIAEDPFRLHLPYWGFPADFVLQGDAAPALRQLAELLPKGKSGTRVEKTKPTDEMPAGAITTAWAAHELNAVFPQNGILVNETITHRLEILKALERLQPGGFFEGSYGGLGGGLGIALGVKQAHPSRPVVVTIGDGAFHYNPVVASFGAAQEHGLGLLVVLFDNAGYLSQKMDVTMYYPDGKAAKAGRAVGTRITPAPDYALLAQAYGGTGERVTKPAEVRAALERGLASASAGRLALVDVVLAPV